MLVITAGRTGPNRSVRFGGDLSLDDGGRRTVSALAATIADDIPTAIGVPCGPEVAPRESCEILGVGAAVEVRLRTVDFGVWSGLTPEDVPPAELAAWFTDLGACPHGGETVVDFVARIHQWRAEQPPTTMCVVSMPVAQALLAEHADDFFAVEVRPAAAYRTTSVVDQ
ncbi:histidine phosphatase family protein [Gordonia hankookensis]|uniref:Histidine phosphatase family protein n=1 Tax=Gordonia hankookensis TaxID=589403 RepID=A0ABR7WGN0_9ACTN|nr:histidine phosphatase family protein [Gordonia hankookensis]MBD1320922.1 histidine phosphatase family protein [Gordonia hankookensis]